MVSQHTGADFESGRLHGRTSEQREAREHYLNREPTSPAPAPAHAQADEPTGQKTPKRSVPPKRHSPRSRVGAEQQGDEIDRMQAELDKEAEAPWFGQAKKLDVAGREILSHFTASVAHENKLHGDAGGILKIPYLKFRTIYEEQKKERCMKGRKAMNISRMGEYLIKSVATPADVKERVARLMRSEVARKFLASLQTSERAQH